MHSLASKLSLGSAPSSPVQLPLGASLSGPLIEIRQALAKSRSADSPAISPSSCSLYRAQLLGPLEVDPLLGHLDNSQPLVPLDLDNG